MAVARRFKQIGYSLRPEQLIYSSSTGSKNALDVESSRVYGFDFAYQGVLSIWEGLTPTSSSRSSATFETPQPSDSSAPTRTSSSTAIPAPGSRPNINSRRLSRTRSTLDPTRLQYETAIETVTSRKSVSLGGIVGVKKEMPKAMVGSSRLTRRQYALSLCDWDLTDAEFEEQIQLYAESLYICSLFI